MRACVGVAICLAAVAVPAGVAQAAVVSVTLSGSNATLTPLTRNPKISNKAVLDPVAPAPA